MSFVYMSGVCAGCNRVFYFHPNKVPSHDGQPICADCMAIVNQRRIASGLLPFPIDPDAYNVADETAIDWEGKPRTVYPRAD